MMSPTIPLNLSLLKNLTHNEAILLELLNYRLKRNNDVIIRYRRKGVLMTTGSFMHQTHAGTRTTMINTLRRLRKKGLINVRKSNMRDTGIYSITTKGQRLLCQRE